MGFGGLGFGGLGMGVIGWAMGVFGVGGRLNTTRAKLVYHHRR